MEKKYIIGTTGEKAVYLALIVLSIVTVWVLLMNFIQERDTYPLCIKYDDSINCTVHDYNEGWCYHDCPPNYKALANGLESCQKYRKTCVQTIPTTCNTQLKTQCMGRT